MIQYRIATLRDNEQLLKLTAGSPMMGKTSLRIDRNPDFFRLLNMRGESSVFVAVDNDKIIGCVCVSLQQVYIDGKIFPVYYVGDFKVAVEYRGKGVGIRLCEELTNYMLSIDADLVFLTVAKGNNKPLPFFKDRPGIPDFTNIGTFVIHQYIGTRKRINNPQYKIEQSDANDEIIDYLNRHCRKYQLGSVITREKLKDTLIYVIRKNNVLSGVMCLIDTMNVKQNVVISLSWDLKYTLKIINAFRKFTGISKMPELNEPVQMIYVRWIAVDNNEKEVIKSLINHAKNIVYDKSYSFLSLGLHEKDVMNKSLPGFLKLSFRASGMFLSIKNNHLIIGKVSNGIPSEDYSLV